MRILKSPCYRFCLKIFYQKNNFTSVQKAYRSEFKNKPVPSICKLKNIVSKFEILNQWRGKQERRRSQVKSDRKPKKLQTMVNDFPNLSIRKAASAFGVYPTLILTILHDVLHLKPY
jgi:hypothetical protein